MREERESLLVELAMNTEVNGPAGHAAVLGDSTGGTPWHGSRDSLMLHRPLHTHTVSCKTVTNADWEGQCGNYKERETETQKQTQRHRGKKRPTYRRASCC